MQSPCRVVDCDYRRYYYEEPRKRLMHNRSSLFMTFRTVLPVPAKHLFHQCTPCSARRLLLGNASRSEDKLVRATEWPVLGVGLFGQKTVLNKEIGMEGADRCDQGDEGS
jgi:hypothetical protein